MHADHVQKKLRKKISHKQKGPVKLLKRASKPNKPVRRKNVSKTIILQKNVYLVYTWKQASKTEIDQ